MKRKMLMTLLVVGLGVAANTLWNTAKAPVVGAATAAQLEDSRQSYYLAQTLREGFVGQGIALAVLAGIVWIWLRPVRSKPALSATPLLLAAALAALVTGCKPVKVLDIVEIKPNETAWAIPLDGASRESQVKFNSIEFLNQKKVAAKRIMIDKVERQIGRMPWDVEWIPSVRVITVDRSLVTREWTDSPNTGTSTHQEGIGVVTADSVKLRVGLTITASIDEDDASTYLYYHGERSLHDVLDQNIRSFAVAGLTREYSQLTLKDAQIKGTEIYGKLFEDAKTAFKAKGITIQYLGNSEGLNYADKSVQESINRSYLAEQDNRTAQMEQNAQKIRNETKILNSQADAEAAQKLYAAQEAAKFNNVLQIALIEAQARATMATRWNGSLPANILPENSPMLLNLGSSANSPGK